MGSSSTSLSSSPIISTEAGSAMRWIGGWIAGNPQPKISGHPNQDRPGSTKEAAMHTSELRHPSPATVMSALALVFSFGAFVVVISGNADAARHAFVKKGDIAPGAV